MRIAVVFLGIAIAALGQSPGSDRRAVQSFAPHDLSGIWLGGVGATRQSGAPPITPWGKAKFDSNKPSFGPRAVPPSIGNDPLGNCDPLGIPRIITSHPSGENRIQFVQTPGRMLELIEYTHIWRDIWMDGRALPTNPDPTWLGYSVGKWDGEEFVVNTVGVDERTWLDAFGDPHSDEMRVEERYRRMDRNTLNVTVVIKDPKTYTKTWDLPHVVYHLDPDAKPEIHEIFCVPSEEQAFNNSIRNPAGGTKDH